jgi:hypothetical protein
MSVRLQMRAPWPQKGLVPRREACLVAAPQNVINILSSYTSPYHHKGLQTHLCSLQMTASLTVDEAIDQ